jgi:opacity protein-like surface antigen
MKIYAPAVIIALCVLACDPVAAAQQSGWYAGVSVGMSSVDLRTSDWDDGTLTAMSIDNESVAYKVTAGYHFTSYFAGELSYVHFGDTKFSGYEPGTTPSIWQTGNVYGRAQAKGMSLEGVLSWPFRDRYAVFAAGGIFMSNTTMSSSPTLSGGTLALSNQQLIHDDAVYSIYGAGADMRIFRKWRIRLEWEHATVGFANTMDRGVDFPSLGVTLDF